jgi:hypothetical protein
MLPAGAGFTVTNRRSEKLHQALFSLFYAPFAVELWSKERSLPGALPWAILVSHSTCCAIDAYAKSKKSHGDADSAETTLFEHQDKSDG